MVRIDGDGRFRKMRFDDRKILVTGAAGGIGRQIVQRFRTAGAQVAVADLDVAALEAEAHLPGDLLDANYADGLPAAAATLACLRWLAPCFARR